MVYEKVKVVLLTNAYNMYFMYVYSMKVFHLVW